MDIENELKKSLENKIEIVEYELSEIEVLFNQKDLNKIVINSDVVTKKIEPMLVFSPKGNEKIAVNKS